MKIGDVVVLSVGGPLMTVEKVLADQVTVIWFANSELQRETLNASALRRARER